jgi:glycerophosphoryl diester phosphodiesterase
MSQNRKFPLIIAHRGASAEAPENTLAAFDLAVADGSEGIEFDVQLAKDGVPVVFHDINLQRMARKTERVSDLTSIELQTLDIGAWFNLLHPQKANPRFIGETVPTLNQLFDFLRDYTGRIYVELKYGESDETVNLVEAVAKAIHQTSLLPNIILKSFELKAVAETRNLFPEIRTAALFAPKFASILRRNWQIRLIEQAKAVGADELSLHYSLATPKMLEAAGQENMPVTIWTVDNPLWLKRFSKMGLRAIISNNPARLLQRRNEVC